MLYLLILMCSLINLLICSICPHVLVQILLVRFGSKIGVTVSKVWRPDVTHVIAATDEKGACMRTLKVLMAIVNGCWVLKIDCKLDTEFCIDQITFFSRKILLFFTTVIT